MTTPKRKFLALFLLMLAVIVHIIAIALIDDGVFTPSIYAMSFIGCLIFVIALIINTINTGAFLNIFNVFTILLFLFCFGQCAMWAIGIHTQTEIGTRLLYGKIPVTETSIAKSQLLSITNILVLSASNSLYLHKTRKKQLNKKAFTRQGLHMAIILASIIVVPISMIGQIIKARASIENGYISLFQTSSGNSLLGFIGLLFYPCIYGLLLTRKRDKSIPFIYLIVAIYMMFSLIIGSRGDIVYQLLILLILHTTFIRKISIKPKTIIIGILALIAFSSIFSIVRETRDYSATNRKIDVSSVVNNNPIIQSTFEMGSTMAVQTAVIENEIKYPYGNTYIVGLVAAPTERIMETINNDYKNLNDWFSSDYLNLDYGAGFSIIAESLINYGPYASPLLMLVISLILVKIEEILKSNNKYMVLLGLITFNYLILSIRGTFGYYFKMWLYTIALFSIIILACSFFRKGDKYAK